MHDTVETILTCMIRYKMYQCTNTGKIDFKRHQLTKLKSHFYFSLLSHSLCVGLVTVYILYHVRLSFGIRLGSRQPCAPIPLDRIGLTT